MPASVCLAALEVPSFVVGVCVLGISWSAFQDTAMQLQNAIFFVGALLLWTSIYLLQIPNQLFRR